MSNGSVGRPGFLFIRCDEDSDHSYRYSSRNSIGSTVSEIETTSESPNSTSGTSDGTLEKDVAVFLHRLSDKNNEENRPKRSDAVSSRKSKTYDSSHRIDKKTFSQSRSSTISKDEKCMYCDSFQNERQYFLWRSQYTRSSFCSRCSEDRSYVSFWGRPSYENGSWRKRLREGRNVDIDLTPLIEVLHKIDSIDTSMGRPSYYSVDKLGATKQSSDNNNNNVNVCQQQDQYSLPKSIFNECTAVKHNSGTHESSEDNIRELAQGQSSTSMNNIYSTSENDTNVQYCDEIVQGYVEPKPVFSIDNEDTNNNTYVVNELDSMDSTEENDVLMTISEELEYASNVDSNASSTNNLNENNNTQDEEHTLKPLVNDTANINENCNESTDTHAKILVKQRAAFPLKSARQDEIYSNSVSPKISNVIRVSEHDYQRNEQSEDYRHMKQNENRDGNNGRNQNQTEQFATVQEIISKIESAHVTNSVKKDVTADKQIKSKKVSTLAITKRGDTGDRAHFNRRSDIAEDNKVIDSESNHKATNKTTRLDKASSLTNAINTKGSGRGHFTHNCKSKELKYMNNIIDSETPNGEQTCLTKTGHEEDMEQLHAKRRKDLKQLWTIGESKNDETAKKPSELNNVAEKKPQHDVEQISPPLIHSKEFKSSANKDTECQVGDKVIQIARQEFVNEEYEKSSQNTVKQSSHIKKYQQKRRLSRSQRDRRSSLQRIRMAQEDEDDEFMKIQQKINMLGKFSKAKSMESQQNERIPAIQIQKTIWNRSIRNAIYGVERKNSFEESQTCSDSDNTNQTHSDSTNRSEFDTSSGHRNNHVITLAENKTYTSEDDTESDKHEPYRHTPCTKRRDKPDTNSYSSTSGQNNYNHNYHDNCANFRTRKEMHAANPERRVDLQTLNSDRNNSRYETYLNAPEGEVKGNRHDTNANEHNGKEEQDDSCVELDSNDELANKLNWRSRGYTYDFFMSRQSRTGEEIIEHVKQSRSNKSSRNTTPSSSAGSSRKSSYTGRNITGWTRYVPGSQRSLRKQSSLEEGTTLTKNTQRHNKNRPTTSGRNKLEMFRNIDQADATENGLNAVQLKAALQRAAECTTRLDRRLSQQLE